MEMTQKGSVYINDRGTCLFRLANNKNKWEHRLRCSGLIMLTINSKMIGVACQMYHKKCQLINGFYVVCF